MSYADKLKDPRWQKKRLEVLEKAKWQCQHCKSKVDTLHVHHLWYESNRDPWDYPDDAYAVFCEDHHKERQNVELAFDKYVRAACISISKLDGLRLCLVESIPWEIDDVMKAIDFLRERQLLAQFAEFQRDWEMLKHLHQIQPTNHVAWGNGSWSKVLSEIKRASPFTATRLANTTPVDFTTNKTLIIGFPSEFADRIELVNDSRTKNVLRSKCREFGLPVLDIAFIVMKSP